MHQVRHDTGMRSALTLLIGASIAGCGPSAMSAPVQYLEVRAAGLEVQIADTGRGHYIYGYDRPRKSQFFNIGPSGFQKAIKAFAPYRSESGSINDVAARISAGACPDGISYGTDQGGISVRWIGRGFDNLFYVDFGCDYEKNASRNEKISAALKSLPIPESISLP